MATKAISVSNDRRLTLIDGSFLEQLVCARHFNILSSKEITHLVYSQRKLPKGKEHLAVSDSATFTVENKKPVLYLTSMQEDNPFFQNPEASVKQLKENCCYTLSSEQLKRIIELSESGRVLRMPFEKLHVIWTRWECVDFYGIEWYPKSGNVRHMPNFPEPMDDTWIFYEALNNDDETLIERVINAERLAYKNNPYLHQFWIMHKHTIMQKAKPAISVPCFITVGSHESRRFSVRFHMDRLPRNFCNYSNNERELPYFLGSKKS